MDQPDPFFVAHPSRDTDFESSPWTRGPWSPAHQHGGPPAALLARSLETELDPGQWRPARVSFELARPVPIGTLRIETTGAYDGGATARRAARLIDAVTGKELMRARALFVRREDTVPLSPPPALPPPPPRTDTRFELTFFTEPVGYHRAMELHLTEGEWLKTAVAGWMRMRVPLVAGESPSPLQRVLTVVDAGSGISAVLDPLAWSFVNADLDLVLNRPLRGEWVGLRARTDVGPDGAGIAHSTLFDDDGPIGYASQSLVVRRR